MKILYKVELNRLKVIKDHIVARDKAMLGGPNGEGSRPPDGDDYNELYKDVTYLLEQLGIE